MPDTKRCARCRQDLSLTAFARRRASADGLQAYCRECVADWARERRPRKLAVPPDVPDGSKWCRRCETVKLVDAFAGNISRPDGLQLYCRECQAADYRARRESQGLLVRPADVPDHHKFCRTCQTIKPLTAWSKNARASDGLQTRCKDCTSAANRRDHLERTYGLTEADLLAMRADQNGVCAICQAAAPVHVDHDHETGTVRGILCFPCNAALGHLRDDPLVIRRAARYLERSRSEPRRSAPWADEETPSVLEAAWRARLADSWHGRAS